MSRVAIFANWKMNMTRAEAESFIRRLVAEFGTNDGVELAVCAPHPYLALLVPLCVGSSIGIGAEDMHAEERGPFTGEVSAPMLSDIGCSYVLLGHSERRAGNQETDEGVQRKVAAALRHGLTPIVCIGEDREERSAGRTYEVLERQVRTCLEGLPAVLFPGRHCWVAYEPRWAIGAGLTPGYDEIREAHDFLRGAIARIHGEAITLSVRLLYGGSVTAHNSAAICALQNVDGLGYGGCSLDFGCFSSGIREVLRARRAFSKFQRAKR